MILQDLTITFFRGITNASLAALSPVSVIFGANNTGKSSILEAAALLLRPVDPSQWVQVARQRDVDMTHADGLWSLFPSRTPLQLEDGPKQTDIIQISGTVGGVQRNLSARGLASMTWDSEESEDLSLMVTTCCTEADHKPTEHRMEFRSRRDSQAQWGSEPHLYRSFTVTPATHRSTRNLVDHLSRAVDEGLKGLAVELLQLFDSEIQGLDVSASRGRDGVRVTHAKRGVVDLASFGDGMRRSAALALALVRAHGGLLLIDEIEAGIHPSILPDVFQRLIQAAREADVQILATTHSLEAIDALIAATNVHPDSLSAFYVERGRTGTSVRPYDRGRLVELREAGLDLR